MKKQLYRVVTGFLLAGWMTVIFLFSAQPAVESDVVSETVSYRVVSAANEIFRLGRSREELLRSADIINYPIRKAAHMSEYAVLGLLSFAFYTSLGIRVNRRYAAALLTTAAYASTDEIHQLFVPGRTGMFQDVCIDTTGAAIGLIFLYFILKLARKHCEKKKLPLQ